MAGAYMKANQLLSNRSNKLWIGSLIFLLIGSLVLIINLENDLAFGQTVDSTPPSVSITSPASGESIPVNTPITVTGTSSDDDSGVQLVQVIVPPGGLITATPGAPDDFSTWSAPVTFSNPGRQAIIVKAVDNAGNVAIQFSSVMVLDESGDSFPPTISITSPISGDIIDVGSTITVSGTASDAETGVQIVQVIVPRSGLITATPGAPDDFSTWSASLTFSELGPQKIFAKAVDNAGNQKLVVVSVTVEEIVPPTSSNLIIFVTRSPNPDPVLMAQIYADMFLPGDMLYQFANELLSPEFDSFPGETSVTFFSLTDVVANVDLLVDNGYEWIVYDLEPQFSPPEDIENAVEFTTLAAEAAHAAGLKIMLTPATFPDEFYIDITPHVDGVIIQGQQVIGVDPFKVRERAEPLIKDMRIINPDILLFLQYNPSLATFDQMVTAYQDNHDILDGHTVFYSCNCVLPNVVEFLEFLQEQRTT